ncbi:MAG: hypothetical protein M3468_12865 [Acidobacteriota bacterium]|nr:hypothetical protein [Acidobacteriota bacterium]
MIDARPRDDQRRAAAASAALIVLAACVPYVSTIDDYFLQDDFGVIHLMVRRSWTMFFRWFTMPWMEDIWQYTPDEIRPFVALSYVMTSWWGAASPVGHHVLNIALHAVNGLLVMQMARTTAGLGRVAALVAGLAFVLLPVQVESVAWITGRVDSMPTLFYFAAFLAYARWRAGSANAYWWALAWYFAALFSKQNTITLPAALVAYDWLVGRRRIHLTWAWLRPYVPFVLMTIGFLALRYAVVGTVVREKQLNAEGFRIFLDIMVRHTARVVVGHAAVVRAGEWIALALLTIIAIAGVLKLTPAERARLAAPALFFGVVWWVLGIAPIIAAGYESPRHVYLAAAAWTILLGIIVEALTRTIHSVRWRRLVYAGATAMLTFYAVQLWSVVGQWNTAAFVSQRAVAELEREVLAAPPGALVIVGAPVRSWEWALPFAAQPPYTGSDLTSRVSLITPRQLDCCPGGWLDHTTRTLRGWNEQVQPGPVIALYFDPVTGALSRRTETEYPPLRGIVQALLQNKETLALDRSILRILHELVAPVRPTVR